MAEDLVARQMIVDHEKHCDKRDEVITGGMRDINQNCTRIWKEIGRGRSVRFKLLVTMMMFLLALIVGLVGYIFTSSQAAAEPYVTCLSHEDMAEALAKTYGETVLFEGPAKRGYYFRLYFDVLNGSWTVTGESGGRECAPDFGTEYKFTPPDVGTPAGTLPVAVAL